LNYKWKSVVGITGSFGKTSTKEFLSTIVHSKYSVLKTELSKNSAIGISETVLSQLVDQEVFVVEMGAYQQGEIASMTELVHPEIGIITAINAQHQDLFGSIDTTMKAKYELLAGLSGKRIAVINADNVYCHEMGKWAKRDGCSVWFVTKNKKLHPEALFFIEDISSDISSCTFTLHYKNESHRITVLMKGEHFVMNITLAIAAAIGSGMPFKEAVEGAQKIRSVERILQVSKGKKGEILINDTFNNNPDAAVAALRYLEKFKKRKILVFQPMIELGAYTEHGHQTVGKIAGGTCDEIILTNSNFSKAFIHGVKAADVRKTVHIFSPEKAASYIRSMIHKDDAILFKGKEAEYVWKLLQ
jgi:UDP-N-acetylmuramoyl-tripeptide--D-alanyl-D-alanine ligase